MKLKQVYPQTPVGFAETLISYITQKRIQLQDWESDPPHPAGWAVFFLVVLEFVMARFLFHQIGFGMRFVGQVLGMGFLLILIQGVFIKISREVASFCGKKGNWKTAWTSLNLGLSPLLLFLPITLLATFAGGVGLIRLLLFFFLVIKVLSNWRLALEVNYEFNRFQASLTVGITILTFGSLTILFSYMTLLGVVFRAFGS